MDTSDHWMVDIETTGLEPNRNAILSIGLLRFDYNTFEATADGIYERIAIPAGRVWDADTEKWWHQQSPEAYNEAVYSGARENPDVIVYYIAKTVKPGSYFWSKPAHFDYPFVASYMKDYLSNNVKNPFNYRKVIDVRSYITGMGPSAVLAADSYEKMNASQPNHMPINDCLYALGMLRAAKTLLDGTIISD